MRHRFISLPIILLTCAFSSNASQTADSDTSTIVLPLEKCIEIALDDNPTIKVADMEISRVDYSKKEILGQLLPNISFGATYNRTLAKQTMYMNMGKMGGSGSTGDKDEPEGGDESSPLPSGNNGIKVGLDNSFSMGFSASMPLIAPQLWKSLKLSDSQILQAVEQARSSKLALVNQVKNAYYTLLLAQDSYKVIQESYDMAKFTADMYAKQFKLGTASQYDVLRTEVAVKNVEPELTQATIAIKQARLQMMILMGLDGTTGMKVEAATQLSDYEKTMYDRVFSIDRKDISNNTELRQLDIQTRQLRDALTVQKMSWYPTLSLSANYNWTSMSNGNPMRNFRWNPYSMIGFTLSVPLFQGGQRYSRIKQAGIQVNEMKWQRENLVRSINMQTDMAFDNIQMNVKQIASCAESVKQAEMAHDIMKKSFTVVGSESYLSLRDSELALTQSRLAYLQSIYNYLIADSDLELLLGTWTGPEK